MCQTATTITAVTTTTSHISSHISSSNTITTTSNNTTSNNNTNADDDDDEMLYIHDNESTATFSALDGLLALKQHLYNHHGISVNCDAQHPPQNDNVDHHDEHDGVVVTCHNLQAGHQANSARGIRCCHVEYYHNDDDDDDDNDNGMPRNKKQRNHHYHDYDQPTKRQQEHGVVMSIPTTVISENDAVNKNTSISSHHHHHYDGSYNHLPHVMTVPIKTGVLELIATKPACATSKSARVVSLDDDNHKTTTETETETNPCQPATPFLESSAYYVDSFSSTSSSFENNDKCVSVSVVVKSSPHYYLPDSSSKNNNNPLNNISQNNHHPNSNNEAAVNRSLPFSSSSSSSSPPPPYYHSSPLFSSSSSSSSTPPPPQPPSPPPQPPGSLLLSSSSEIMTSTMMTNHLHQNHATSTPPPPPPPTTTPTPTSNCNNNNNNNNKAVHFGWIRHPATKLWRDVIKVFSQNPLGFPSWTDHICDLIKAKLNEEHGICEFFVCRRPTLTTMAATTTTMAAVPVPGGGGGFCGNGGIVMPMSIPMMMMNGIHPINSNLSTSTATTTTSPMEQRKKIFGKNKTNLLGTWEPASNQEILDRTKQRFVDDRKPNSIHNHQNAAGAATATAGVKRPRGRPPKILATASSLVNCHKQSGCGGYYHGNNDILTSAKLRPSTASSSPDDTTSITNAVIAADVVKSFLKHWQELDLFQRSSTPSSSKALPPPPASSSSSLMMMTRIIDDPEINPSQNVHASPINSVPHMLPPPPPNHKPLNGASANVGNNVVASAASVKVALSLTKVMRDLECVQMALQTHVESTLKRNMKVDGTHATKDDAARHEPTSVLAEQLTAGSEPQEPQPQFLTSETDTPLLAVHNIRNDISSGNTAISISTTTTSTTRPLMMMTMRRPWLPILSDQVCFGWNNHAGTIKWCEAVKQFSDDRMRYPEWNDAIAHLVQEKLASDDDCIIFLVFLDAHGRPCESIRHGLWYLATEEEVVHKTKEQFWNDRRLDDDAADERVN